MISRILVPRNASLPAEGTVEPGKRRKTELDSRTLIAGDLPATPLDARTNIPAYMPLDVLSSRQLIARDMAINPIDLTHTIPSYVPLDVLGEHVAVPKDAVLPQIEPKRQPVQYAAEMPEVLEPDVMTTGEVNLLTGTPRSLRDEARWVLRGTSAVLHVTALLLILLIPSLFTQRQPTQAEIESAEHSLGDLYIPPDMKSFARSLPGPKSPMRIDPKIIRQLTPPTVAQPAPGPISPPSLPHEQPKDIVPPAPNISSALPEAPEPVKPAPHLEPVKPDQSPTPNGLVLPKFSAAGSQIKQSLSDAVHNGAGGSTSIGGVGRMPGGHGSGGGYGGGGGGVGQAGAGLTRLTPDQGVDFSNYDMRVYESVKRNWFAIMPESAEMGDQGTVLLHFCIRRDGSVVTEEPVVDRPSGKPPLDSAATGSIRASSPFEPLPAAFQGPCVEYLFMYCYNVTPCGK
jgi:outer membrane biosynthesis protein TonB